VIETSALDRIVDLARAVRGDDHDGRRFRADRAKLGNRDLELREHFEEISLEWLVGAVELVDEEHGAMPSSGDSASSSGRFSRKRGAKMSCASARDRRAGRFREPDLDHLPRIVPFVRRRRDVEPFVALEPDELPVERLASTLASSVLPTPASPSRNIGRPS
jgi:hypothetical protein